MTIAISGQLITTNLEQVGLLIAQIIPDSKFRIKTKGEEIQITSDSLDLDVYENNSGCYLVSGYSPNQKDYAVGLIRKISVELEENGFKNFRFELSEEDESGNFIGDEVIISGSQFI